MTEHDLGTYQMLWDCPTCGTEKLLGLDHRHCPNCGAAQDPARRYFPSDADKIAVKDHPYTGADVVCPACESPCSRAANNCPNCGSPVGEGKEVARRDEQRALDGVSFGTDSAKRAADEHKARKQAAREARDAPPTPPRSHKTLYTVLGVVGLLVVLAIVVATWKKPVEVEVVGHAWSRRVAVEELRRVPETAWRDQVPFGAYDLSCHREQRSTRQVPDGERCSNVRRDLGNGTFKEVRECQPKYRDEPVYGERCTFLVERWVEAREAKAEGRSLEPAPRWPDPNLRRTGNCLGCEREGRRDERYEVRFRLQPAGKEDSCTFPEVKWRTFSPGAHFPAKSRVIGGGLDCDSVGAR